MNGVWEVVASAPGGERTRRLWATSDLARTAGLARVAVWAAREGVEFTSPVWVPLGAQSEFSWFVERAPVTVGVHCWHVHDGTEPDDDGGEHGGA